MFPSTVSHPLTKRNASGLKGSKVDTIAGKGPLACACTVSHGYHIQLDGLVSDCAAVRKLMDADLYLFCELVDKRDSEQADDVSLT
jgi:hypothetical protein